MLTTVIAVGIGMIVLFLGLALFTSAVNEAIASLMSRRASFLRKGLANLLSDPTSVEGQIDRIYDHGLVKALGRAPGVVKVPFRRGVRLPSYIPAGTFATALLDSYAPESPPEGWTWREDVDGILARVRQPDLEQALRSMWRDINGDVDRFRERLEGWYDESMQRVSGWYTRRTQLWLWVIGGILVLALNADSVMVARSLWADPALRDAVVEQAGVLAESDDLDEVAEQVADVEALQIPLGWDDDADPRDLRDRPDGVGDWALKALGLVVTVGAVSLGASFWFDLLGRVSRVRQSGSPPKPA